MTERGMSDSIPRMTFEELDIARRAPLAIVIEPATGRRFSCSAGLAATLRDEHGWTFEKRSL